MSVLDSLASCAGAWRGNTKLQDPMNNVAFHCYFDINESDHGHQLSPGVEGTGKNERTQFPKSAARFRELFTGKR